MGQEHKEYTWNLIAKKLSGEATPEELQELELLLRSNPELHYPMQTIADLWKSTGRQEQKKAEQAFNRHLDRMQDLNIDFNPGTSTPAQTAQFMQQPEPLGQDYAYPFADPKRGASRRMVILVSSFFLLLGMGIMWLSPRTAKTPVASNTPAAAISGMIGGEIFTGNGSRTHLVLPDGTLVWLNAGSRIRYEKNFGTDLREVTLIGEAFFDVAQNARKPFVIHTEKIDIKVLGTRFNVKSYPLEKTTEATLIRGSIEVSIKARPNERIILKPNEKLVVANDDSTLHRSGPAYHSGKIDESLVAIRKPTYESHTGTIIETSWIDNKLIFQDEEFRELARKMERWYGVTIRFDNPRQEELHFTGSFQKETIQQALEALKLTAVFKYAIEGNQITVYDK
ncbi:FecR family protein [Flavitalea flava]